MIYLITGQPGHGKTLRAMQLALEFKDKGRDVYVSGVRGLKTAEAGFIDLPDPTKWMDLPDGAVVVLDECYSAFPRRMPGAKVPPHVELMATHRHRGFDFILICQQAKQQIDIFLLGLVDRHEHVRRKFGMKKSVILWWDKFSENTNDSATKRLWSFPREVMRRNLYESTVQDTTQKKVPWFFFALPLAVLFLLFVGWRVFAWFTPQERGVPATSVPNVGSTVTGVSMGGGGARVRPTDLPKWLEPRIAGAPWSAPAFDDRPVVSEPELYCLAVEDGSCNCITEQGTRYELDVKVCRAIVYSGGVYNPTRRPPDRQQDRQQRPDMALQGSYSPPPGRPVVDGQLVGVGASGLNHGAGVGKSYAGPEYQRWDADPSVARR